MLDITTAGTALVVLGFALVVIAMLTSNSRSEVKGAAVIMIGPLPLVFGSDAKWAIIAMALAVALVLLGLLFYVF